MIVMKNDLTLSHPRLAHNADSDQSLHPAHFSPQKAPPRPSGAPKTSNSFLLRMTRPSGAPDGPDSSRGPLAPTSGPHAQDVVHGGKTNAEGTDEGGRDPRWPDYAGKDPQPPSENSGRPAKGLPPPDPADALPCRMGACPESVGPNGEAPRRESMLACPPGLIEPEPAHARCVEPDRACIPADAVGQERDTAMRVRPYAAAVGAPPSKPRRESMSMGQPGSDKPPGALGGDHSIERATLVDGSPGDVIRDAHLYGSPYGTRARPSMTRRTKASILGGKGRHALGMKDAPYDTTQTNPVLHSWVPRAAFGFSMINAVYRAIAPTLGCAPDRLRAQQ